MGIQQVYTPTRGRGQESLFLPTANTVGYWKLNGNANATVGTNGTATDVTWTGGVFGNCASFNGSSSKISSTITGNATFTISCWVKFAVVGLNKYLVTRRNTTNNANYSIVTNITTGKLQISSYNGTTGVNIIGTTTTFSTGVWYHIVGVFNGASSASYINGQLEASGTLQTHTSGNDVFLGANSTSDFLNGSLDEVIIENRAWTATEILTYYNNNL